MSTREPHISDVGLPASSPATAGERGSTLRPYFAQIGRRRVMAAIVVSALVIGLAIPVFRLVTETDRCRVVLFAEKPGLLAEITTADGTKTLDTIARRRVRRITLPAVFRKEGFAASDFWTRRPFSPVACTST